MENAGSIMPTLDRSRPARMALALFGLVGAAVLGVILGVVREAGWLGLLFALAFALALRVEIAGGWQESTRRSRRRLLQAFSFVLGLVIFAVVAYREGWEAVLFLLMFLAVWQLASVKPTRGFLAGGAAPAAGPPRKQRTCFAFLTSTSIRETRTRYVQ